MIKKYLLPPELGQMTTQEAYSRWLHRKAAAHAKRDRARGHDCTISAYKDAIHQAVVAANGRDAYTGEPLEWGLISTYDNDASRNGKHHYKASFALLPTIDHVEASSKTASFKVCAWRTNDAKNDLSHEAFVELCQRVLEHEGHRVTLKSKTPRKRKPQSAGTTAIGYRNRNGQIVVRGTQLPGNDHLQRIYVLRCEKCSTEYGANGSDIFLRRCPHCDGGRPGLDYRSTA